MKWKVSFLPEAIDDLKKLDRSQQILVNKAILKVSTNPLPQSEGGYGKPLGNKGGRNLSGLMKIKLKDAGLRVVYTLVRTETEMLIIVVGARKDEEVYEAAKRRMGK
ncbi:MAG: type II toxin-antitoxin system RelE/ParE family toxin [Lachnospiraceae bacterium]|nr:type II toxin-antitoxin system RelE/ParE family toxin [Lachnospiraceae bacterium]